MRIAIVSDLWVPFPDGAERYVFNMARELKNRGHEISVLTSYIKSHEFDGIVPTWKSVGCHAYDDNPGHTHADGLRDINEFLDGAKPDVILTHQFFSKEFDVELFGSLRPVIQIVHNGVRNPKATLAIYNSNYTRARANSQTHDMTILPPAFDDCIASRHDDFVGFIKPIPHKGVNFFYQVAAQCPNKNFLVLRGEWQNFEDIRRGLPNVFFIEPVDEMRVFYERCRIILVPSLQEDAGTVPQEAALNSLPCLSSGVMGLAETNRGGIVLSHSAQEWAVQIQMLDSQDYYASIVSRQKEYIKSLNWKGQFDALSDKIKSL